MLRRFFGATLCALSFMSAFPQNSTQFGFLRSQNIAVLSCTEQPFSYPWAGGINSARCATIDLNLDGIQDLILFEKHGNRLLPFINSGIADSISFAYAPNYFHNFPKLHNWAIFKDYNQDGKVDIFTYGLAGISIYKNISTEENVEFELVTDQLTSFYYDGWVNLYTSPDDYLAIEDIDGDGDLDILNFWILGKYVHYHRNYSMENYGNAEHFDFRLADECWGHFEEGESSNSILLNSTCGAKDEPTRHVGSTLLVRDVNGDGLQDLILGDIDFPNLLLLKNEGTIQEAHIGAVDTLFPNSQQPVWLYSMPVASFVDIDNNGQDELIASPSDPVLTKSQDINSMWVYRYDNETETYTRLSDSFLQDQMIDVGSGAVPILYDWNADGLMDLFVANYGSYDSATYINGFLTTYFSASISYFKNIGTRTNPAFKLITNDFGNLKHLNLTALVPAFGDIDGDGKIDMLCGTRSGEVAYFRNLGDTIPHFAPPIIPYDQIDVGDFAAPQLFDLDGDGREDLLIGNRRGFIAYYRNCSPAGAAQFQHITDTLGAVDVRNAELSYFGYLIPHFFKNNAHEIQLFCGTEQGKILHYNQIDNNIDGVFYCSQEAISETIGARLYTIAEGTRVAPAVYDLNSDGYLDMFVGNYAGGISLFMGTEPLPATVTTYPSTIPSPHVFPNPTKGKFVIECPTEESYSLIICDLTGRERMKRQISHIKAEIDISHFPAGAYIGTLILGKGANGFKVIKL